MFFNRNKPQEQTGLTDGIEDKVSDFVKDWGALKRGEREFTADSQEPPLQLLTDADVAVFVKAMEDEAAKIEAEINDVRRQRNADIAQKDAQIAAINRQIELTKARIEAQDAEIDRRGEARANLLSTVAKIAPSLDTSGLRDADIRKEVVRSKFGDAAVNDRSEAYIDERFESLEAQSSVDPFARVVADGLVSNVSAKDAADKAWHDMVADMNNAHRKH